MPEALRLSLLAVVAFIAALLAAVTGFGGAAVLLPMLVFVFGVREAIPILTVAQLIGNGSRVWFNRHELDLRVVAWFALGGVPMALVGWLSIRARAAGRPYPPSGCVPHPHRCASAPAKTLWLQAAAEVVRADRRGVEFSVGAAGERGSADGAVLSCVRTGEGSVHRDRSTFDGGNARGETDCLSRVGGSAAACDS